MTKRVVSMKNIVKEFSGVRVLEDVNFNIYEGRVMGLLGENGAGKSTLMKILTGVYEKTKGTIFVDDIEVNFKGTSDSQKKGIAIIHQELNLLPNMTIAENIFVGREEINKLHKIN